MALCPYCERDILWVEPVVPDQGRFPKVGEFSLCTGCRKLLVFESVTPLKHRKPTTEERREAMELADMVEAKRQLGSK